MAGEVHVLGGRRFHTADLDRRTVRQHHYLVAVTREVVAPKRMPNDENDFGVVLTEWEVDVLASGKACELLGAFLLPEGKVERDWTREMATDTQSFLEQLDREEDRNLVDGLVMECLVGFFQHALRQLQTSLKSFESRSAPTPDDPSRAAA